MRCNFYPIKVGASDLATTLYPGPLSFPSVNNGGKTSAVFLILLIFISCTKSAIFDNVALLYIAFAKCLKMADFHTLKIVSFYYQ